jgi:hypothetical protein
MEEQSCLFSKREGRPRLHDSGVLEILAYSSTHHIIPYPRQYIRRLLAIPSQPLPLQTHTIGDLFLPWTPPDF